MRVLLTAADGCPGYELVPCNKRIAARMLRATGEESVLFQTDWDYPALASNLGWNMRSRNCQHRDTDGTIDCPDCGKTAIGFIAAATDWLDTHCGDTFNKPVEDYFNVEG